ncbi:MAG: M23 family metallopeptidase [Bacteroidales bacterium]|nr:M23 family metallopeptidase [Bacteroidales bacterium]
MAKIKYRFDPHTITYQRINKTAKRKVLQGFLYFGITLVAAIVFNIIFTAYFDTPREHRLKNEKEELVFKYEMLSQNIEHVNQALNYIEQRDDHLYRPIFELDPIPGNVREAGFGGTNRYDELKKYSNSDIMVSTTKELDKLENELYIQSKSFDSVIKEARNKEKMIARIPAIQPISIKDYGRISDYYGRRRDPFTGNMRMHRGMDFTGPIGTEIYATGKGVIEQAGYSAYGYGKEVVINHGYGYRTVYAHLDEIHVEKGDTVSRGEVIGTLGNTGRSTGPHLHYEVRKGNRAVNPFHYYFDDITADQYDKMISAAEENRRPMD